MDDKIHPVDQKFVHNIVNLFSTPQTGKKKL